VSDDPTAAGEAGHDMPDGYAGLARIAADAGVAEEVLASYIKKNNDLRRDLDRLCSELARVTEERDRAVAEFEGCASWARTLSEYLIEAIDRLAAATDTDPETLRDDLYGTTGQEIHSERRQLRAEVQRLSGEADRLLEHLHHERRAAAQLVDQVEEARALVRTAMEWGTADFAPDRERYPWAYRHLPQEDTGG
jgi:chromosome segregation ATPase